MAGIKNHLLGMRDKLFSVYEAKRLKNKSYVIVTNNCWGYELYGSTGNEYNTPFVGLFLFPECYLRFLENFDHCLDAELTFTRTSKYYPQNKTYPIGLLDGDIEIHFLHYVSDTDAREKWNRRINRLKLAVASGANIFVKLCDCEGCTPQHLSRFHQLHFQHKLSIGLQKFANKNHLWVPFLCNQKGTALIDGARLFKKRYTYFDITKWMLEGTVAKTFTSRFFSLFP